MTKTTKTCVGQVLDYVSRPCRMVPCTKPATKARMGDRFEPGKGYVKVRLAYCAQCATDHDAAVWECKMEARYS